MLDTRQGTPLDWLERIVATGVLALVVGGSARPVLTTAARTSQLGLEAAARAFEQVKPFSRKKRREDDQSSIHLSDVDNTTNLSRCARTASVLHLSEFIALAAEIRRSG